MFLCTFINPNDKVLTALKEEKKALGYNKMGRLGLFLLPSLLPVFLPDLGRQLSRAEGSFLSFPHSILGVCLHH